MKSKANITVKPAASRGSSHCATAWWEELLPLLGGLGEVPGKQTGGPTQLRIHALWGPCRVLRWVNPWVLQGMGPKAKPASLAKGTGQGPGEEVAVRAHGIPQAWVQSQALPLTGQCP